MKKVRYLAGLAGLAPAAAGVMTGTAAHAAEAGGSPGHDTSARPTAAKSVSLHHLTTRGASAGSTVYSCFSPKSGYYDHCNAPIIHAPPPNGVPLYSAIDLVLMTLYNGNRVKVTCWYKSSRGAVQDHVVREHVGNTFYYKVGHVSDYNVDFSGLYPKSVPLRHC